MKALKYLKDPFATYKLPFFILLFFCFSAAILGDSVAEALLLAHFSASIIPKMFLVNALFLFLFSFFIIAIIDRFDRGFLFLTFIISHCVLLLLIWISVKFDYHFFYIFLFSYAYTTKIFLFLLFWTLANDLVDTRSAGKEFPLIAAGGTLGAIIISFTIPWLVKLLSAENLLLVWVFLIFCLALLFMAVRRRFGNFFKQSSVKEKFSRFQVQNLLGDLRLVYKEPLLMNMSTLYFLLFFIILNQHYVFYDIIKERFIKAEVIAGFLGYFNGLSMGTTFIMQITIAGLLLKRIGSTRSMLFLPLVFCLVFFSQSIIVLSSGSKEIVTPNLLFIGIILGVGLRIAFFDSFFSPNFQIFFSSLPKNIRGRGKLVIEGLVKPLSMVIASLWLMMIATQLTFLQNTLILFAISLIMVYQTLRIRSKYTKSLLLYLNNFKTRLLMLDESKVLDSKSILSFLTEKLTHESFAIRCYVIEILAKMDTKESRKILIDLLSTSDNKTCATIISSLATIKNEANKDLFISQLENPDERVVANSIGALGAFRDNKINARLANFLMHKNNRIRANTLIAVWSTADFKYRQSLFLIIQEMLDSDDLLSIASVLYALYHVDHDSHISSLLESFFTNKVDMIISNKRIWYHCLRALGKNWNQNLVFKVVELAAQVNNKQRNDIIAAIGEACNRGFSFNRLLTDFAKKDVVIKGVILKVANWLGLVVTKELEMKFISLAEEEAGHIDTHIIAYKSLLLQRSDNAIALLTYAIREEFINSHLQNLINIAVILDKSKQVKSIVSKLNHDNKHIRAQAIEVFDNTGNTKINRMVIKLIDEIDTCDKIPISAKSHAEYDTYLLSIITSYTTNSSEWVRQCAFYSYTAYKNRRRKIHINLGVN